MRELFRRIFPRGQLFGSFATARGKAAPISPTHQLAAVFAGEPGDQRLESNAKTPRWRSAPWYFCDAECRWRLRFRGYACGVFSIASGGGHHPPRPCVQPVTAIQNEYSLWTRDAEPEVLPLCKELWACPALAERHWVIRRRFFRTEPGL
jgi:hypothetical protein